MTIVLHTAGILIKLAQRVLSTHMGYTYPNHKGNYYYRNHTLYHIGTLDPLGLVYASKVEQRKDRHLGKNGKNFGSENTPLPGPQKYVK